MSPGTARRVRYFSVEGMKSVLGQFAVSLLTLVSLAVFCVRPGTTCETIKAVLCADPFCVEDQRSAKGLYGRFPTDSEGGCF